MCEAWPAAGSSGEWNGFGLGGASAQGSVSSQDGPSGSFAKHSPD